MSKLSQGGDADDAAIKIRSFGVTFRTAHMMPPPAPGWHQLMYASRGVLTVHTGTGTWLAPPHRAVWVPEKTSYRVEMSGLVALRALYFRARLTRFSRECTVVNVTPLLRELIVRTVQLGALDARRPEQRRLIRVIVDELQRMETAPLQLPMPLDERALRVARGEAVERSGAAARTLQRIFQSETGMGMGQWLRRKRLLDALRRLAAGETVTAVALELGYSSASAFVAMFRRELGETPGQYFRR